MVRINNQITPSFSAFTGKFNPRMINCFDSHAYCKAAEYNIEKKIFNYAASGKAREVRPYTGPIGKTAGLSTESPIIGGGWIKSLIKTPLSTTGIHTCALVNLVNETTKEQLFYHVYHNTNFRRVQRLIEEHLPNFTKANILGGDQYPTIKTLKEILYALDRVNTEAEKVYYKTVSQNPEIVAYKGELFYMRGQSGTLSFNKSIKNYWY